MNTTTTSPETESKVSPQVEQNLEALMAIHLAAEQAVTKPQRAIERLVAVVAVPAFLIGVLVASFAWIMLNLGLRQAQQPALDVPPFGWLQTAISLLSLTVAAIVVITQNRQGKVADLHAKLDFQVNLLVDQKVSKVIALLEEMRVEMPNLRNRKDDEADELKEAVDPASLANLITDKLAEAMSEAIDEAVEEALDEPQP